MYGCILAIIDVLRCFEPLPSRSEHAAIWRLIVLHDDADVSLDARP